MFIVNVYCQNNELCVCVVCQVASVSQSPELFCGSLRYNIAYGLNDCTIEEVEAAAKAANADAFISKLDHGYDTGTDVRTPGIPPIQCQFIDSFLLESSQC